MVFIGVENSYAAGVNWQDGLRDLDSSSFKKLDYSGHSVNSHQQKVAQYLEREPRFERGKNFKDVLTFNALLFNQLLNFSDERRVVIGGDHAIAMATVEASLAALKDGEKLNIIWIDAHGDYNTPDTSPSANIHGMPLYYLLNCSSYKKRINKVFLFGTTSVDKEEQRLIDGDDRIIEVPNARIQNAEQLWHKVKVNAGSCPCHISFDIDALQLSEAPATGCQVEEGLSFATLKRFFELAMSSSLKIKGIDIVEYNPDLDQAYKTRDLVLDLMELIENLAPEKNTQFIGEQAPEIIDIEKKYLQKAQDYIM